jgi:hypothetical protein
MVIFMAKFNEILLKICMSQEAGLIILCIGGMKGMARVLKLFNIQKTSLYDVNTLVIITLIN